ncbi:MAG TPA: type II secretion system inner membrane protein GspF [Casimicrobiaceae bacterium]|jgi:general secretion pathway protein F|nr:type II secretion system inner membrane protein GspF [Casimicrobiaceae bacterium]
MPAFRYEAVDGAGRPRRGLLDAASARAVRDALRGDGLFPTAVEAAAPAFAMRTDATRLAPATLALVTRQLATLVLSGMPLDQALAAVAEQADHPGAVRLLTAIREQVAAGEAFAGALSRFPRTFSELYRGLAAVGAESGQLGAVLSRLADYLEARQVLRQKFTAALIYPALVTVVALAVIAALLLYVVPQIVAVYQQSRQTLPWLTRALIASSEFVRATGWYWLGLLLVVGTTASLLLRRERWRDRAQAFLLRTPIIGTVLSGLDTARFASTLSILIGSGAPLLRALETAAGVIWARPIRHAAHAAAGHVREGVSLARALASQRVFPALLVHLVANGEQSGQLPAMLERAAREQDADVERRLTWLAALVQPVLIVVMGGIVLVLVLAVMLPIVSMNQLIR